MIGDTYVAIYSVVNNMDAEGNLVPVLTFLKNIRALGGVQPTSAKKVPMNPIEATGRLTLLQDMHLYFYPDNSVTEMMRVKNGSDWYQINAINVWPTNYEALLVPVQP